MFKLLNSRSAFHNNKPIRFIQRVIFLTFLLTVWFLGSVTVIQIDFENRTRSLAAMGQRGHNSELGSDRNKTNHTVIQLENLSLRIDSYCRHLIERKALLSQTMATDDGESEAAADAEIAKREKFIRDNLLYFPELNQMWCLVPKAASTSWSKIIHENLNIRNSSSEHSSKMASANRNATENSKSVQEMLKAEYSYISKDKYNAAVRGESVRKILLVRHPFARLVSAFQDKLQNRTARTDGRHFFQTYGAQIYRKYRKTRTLKQKEPTFPEFVDYLIDTDPINYDPHWQPISLLCGLCNVRYDIVIKMEDLPETTSILMSQLSLKNGHAEFPHENKMEKVEVAQFYRNISRSKMVLLFKKYEMDFHLFDYNFLDYYVN